MTALSELEAVLAKPKDFNPWSGISAVKFVVKHADLLRQRLVEPDSGEDETIKRLSREFCPKHPMTHIGTFRWAFNEFKKLYAAPPATNAEPVHRDLLGEHLRKIRESIPKEELRPAKELLDELAALRGRARNTLTFDEARACVARLVDVYDDAEYAKGWEDSNVETLRNIDERERRG